MDKFDLLPYTKTDDVLKDSRQIIEAAQKKAYQTVNILLVERNWLLENQAGCPHFLAKRRIEAGSQLEEVGKDLRSKMSWGTKVEEL